MFQKAVRILVIDDEEDFSFFIKKNLERHAYQVWEASSGIKGLELAKRKKPDLIFLDIMMPGINGFEVLKRLKADEDTRSIPVIMLTGREDEEAKKMAQSLANEDYLVKPVELEELNSRIENVLSRHPQDK